MAKCPAPALRCLQATRGPSWGGSWPSASVSRSCVSKASRACEERLKPRASNSPAASEAPNQAMRPIATHQAFMSASTARGGPGELAAILSRRDDP